MGRPSRSIELTDMFDISSTMPISKSRNRIPSMRVLMLKLSSRKIEQDEENVRYMAEDVFLVLVITAS